mmetsp:Transcript_30644/g.64857  ORF Transcript_30644/g.64857 Transcript_30644/m.64857 type:complete len:228 (-) Transcript_30644:766-1449(-)
MRVVERGEGWRIGEAVRFVVVVLCAVGLVVVDAVAAVEVVCLVLLADGGGGRLLLLPLIDDLDGECGEVLGGETLAADDTVVGLSLSSNGIAGGDVTLFCFEPPPPLSTVAFVNNGVGAFFFKPPPPMPSCPDGDEGACGGPPTLSGDPLFPLTAPLLRLGLDGKNDDSRVPLLGEGVFNIRLLLLPVAVAAGAEAGVPWVLALVSAPSPSSSSSPRSTPSNNVKAS